MLTDEDQALRRGRITGSNAAAILGLDPFSSPLRAWLQITGRAAVDNASRAVFERGHVLEPALVQWAAEKLAAETESVVAIDRPPTRAHPDLPWAACSIDAVIVSRPAGADRRRVVALDDLTVPRDAEESILVQAYGTEAKTVGQDHAFAWGEPWTDQIPDHVAVQCEWELMHDPDLVAVLVPALVGANLDLRLYWWQHDPRLRSALVGALEPWHRRHVIGNTPPPPIPGDAGIVSRAWTPSGRKLPDDPRIAELVRRDCEARELIRRAEVERDAARVGIAAIMRDATECRGAWGSVTWRGNRSGGRTMTTRWRGNRR